MYRHYTSEEKRHALELYQQGYGARRIARALDAPVKTVQYWLQKHFLFACLDVAERNSEWMTPCTLESLQDDQHRAYAYVLGMYLGDGCVAANKKTFCLRIYLDSRYPELIQECSAAIQTVLPGHTVGCYPHGENCVVVSSYSKDWPTLLPQSGPGRKHSRTIQLLPVQREIVEHYPEAFLRGCIHSDGCRHRRIVKGKDYPAYAFCNTSEDILQLFMWACDLICIHYTRSSAKNISIARRADVARLDEIVGAKT